jgi:heat shock protein HslJ
MEKCLQIKVNQDGPWQVYAGTIKGFEFEKGYFYKLKVSENASDNSSASGISLSYTLVDILEKSKTTLTLDNGYWIVVGILETKRLPRNPVFSIVENTIEGNTSCNKFSGTIDLDKNTFQPNIVSITEMGCNTLSVEQLFLKTLPEVKRYQIKGDSLLLLDKHKKKIMACVYSHE